MASTRYYAEVEGGTGDRFHWDIDQGGTNRLQFTVKDWATGAAVDITGWTSFRFVAKHAVSDADADAVFSETLAGGGITKVTPLSGILQVELLRADSSALTLRGELGLDLVADLHGVEGGRNWRLARGTATLRPDVARTSP